MLFGTGFNNVLLSTLFTVGMFSVVAPDSGSTILFIIVKVDNFAQCGQYKIVQSCYIQQARSFWLCKQVLFNRYKRWEMHVQPIYIFDQLLLHEKQKPPYRFKTLSKKFVIFHNITLLRSKKLKYGNTVSFLV